MAPKKFRQISTIWKWFPYAKYGLFIVLVCCISYQLWVIFFAKWNFFTEPYYTEAIYKSYEGMFDNSQYRIKNPTSIIPDEVVFSYASGAYLRGIDPILINSEHTPLGKYILGLSIQLLHTDRFPIMVFGLLTVIVTWLIGTKILHSTTLALVPASLLLFEPLFQNQFIYVPLLDIIQLPFILTSLYICIIQIRFKYLILGVLLGLVMATKSVVPAILLYMTIGIWLLLYRKYSHVLLLVLSIPISLFILMLSYFRTFETGHSLWEFFRFQKWIFMYQKSKILFPFSYWRLILFNQWQTWWEGNKIVSTNDWIILWPIMVINWVIFVLFALFRTLPSSVILLLIWCFVYQMFLSIGIVSTRFFLPILPIFGILFVFGMKLIWDKLHNKILMVA